MLGGIQLKLDMDAFENVELSSVSSASVKNQMPVKQDEESESSY